MKKVCYNMSLHTKYGKKAPLVLQKAIKQNIKLPKNFQVTDNGNHYVVSNSKNSIEIPLFAAQDVFRALSIFCS